MEQSKYQIHHDTISRMQEATRRKFGDYGFACGYLGSVLSHVLSELNEEEREKVLRQIDKTTLEFGI